MLADRSQRLSLLSHFLSSFLWRFPDISSCALCSAFEVTLLPACSPSHSLSLKSCCCHHTPIRLLLSTVRFHAVSPNCHIRFWFKHLFLPLPGKLLQNKLLSVWMAGRIDLVVHVALHDHHAAKWKAPLVWFGDTNSQGYRLRTSLFCQEEWEACFLHLTAWLLRAKPLLCRKAKEGNTLLPCTEGRSPWPFSVTGKGMPTRECISPAEYQEASKDLTNYRSIGATQSPIVGGGAWWSQRSSVIADESQASSKLKVGLTQAAWPAEATVAPLPACPALLSALDRPASLTPSGRRTSGLWPATCSVPMCWLEARPQNRCQNLEKKVQRGFISIAKFCPLWRNRNVVSILFPFQLLTSFSNRFLFRVKCSVLGLSSEMISFIFPYRNSEQNTKRSRFGVWGAWAIRYIPLVPSDTICSSWKFYTCRLVTHKWWRW